VPCLDPDSVQALLAGGLVGPARADAEAHLDGCDECRQVVASLVRQSTVDHPSPAAIGGLSTIADRVTAPTGPSTSRAGVIALAPGTMVGRYRVKATLGAGGMGVVYRAVDPELGRDVALKLLRGDRAGDDEERRLVREGQALAKVSHPNVIAVHDVGTTDGRVWVAMELVNGTNLREWLAERQRSFAEVLAVLAASGRGLAAAHAAGLVHRDFKPDNVLVGRDGRVRVTDFGLARRERQPGPVTSGSIALRGDEPVDAVLTREGALVGSPAYMAPEQLAGDHVDARSDQFGFCVTLHEALYGARPFAGKTLFELEDNVTHGRVAPPPPGTARVPAGLRAIVLRGLSVRPGDRFPAMDHLLAALGRSRARGLRVIAAIAASLALAAGVGLFADWLARERQATYARAAFVAQTEQLDGSLDLKFRAFKVLADSTRGLPTIQAIMGNRDQADFGLGSEEEDRARLQELHDGMLSDEWLGVVGTTSGGQLAVSDYKGRLLFTSAAPERWGTDVQIVPEVARAMTPDVVYAGAMLRGDDPALVASGLVGDHGRAEWELLFVRQFNADRAVQGLFVQMIDAAKLLAGLRVGEQTLATMVSPAGDSTAAMPPALVAAGLRAVGRIGEVEHDGRTWSVHASELGNLGDRDRQPIARIVIASPLDATGLFASARLWFSLALAASLLIAAITLVASRRSARLLGAVTAGADASDAGASPAASPT